MPKKKFEEEDVQANLLPVMNIMFLLIPALLMAMEFASMAAINVSPPKFAVSAEQKEPEEKKEKPLNLKVFVMEDGYRVSADGQQEGAEAGKAQDSKAPTIPLAKAGAPLTDYERYDYNGARGRREEVQEHVPQRGRRHGQRRGEDPDAGDDLHHGRALGPHLQDRQGAQG
jgi:hypothetical protein